jgi:type I restriction enzyme S subunit
MKGWQQKTLGEVCEVVNGGTPKTSVADYWDGDHLWITPAEMGKRSSPYVSQTERKLTALGLGDSSARLLPPLSVILSSRAPIGHLVINTEPMATNQGCKGLVPGKSLDYKFLFHYLGSIVGLLNDLGTGATFKELSGAKVKEVPLPVPPLPEQKRIVALLDETFEGIGTAVANAEKNLANARELFESYLNSVFTRKGEGWVEATVEELVGRKILSKPLDGNHGEIHPKKAEFVSSGVPFIMASDLMQGVVNQENCNFLLPKQASSLRTGFSKDGDVLLSHKGTIGRAAILHTSRDYVLLTPQVTYYRVVYRSSMSNRFLYYMFQTK